MLGSLGNQTPAEAPSWFAGQATAGNGRALEQFEGSTPDALARTNDEEYEIQMLCLLKTGSFEAGVFR
jgi:hypothetical protein